MRFLGIDYGAKRVGLAISDENHRLAFPKKIISNDKEVFNIIAELIKQENITDIVVGESLDFSGKPNVISEKIDIFIKELEKSFGLDIHREKEFLTSIEARKMGNTKLSNHKSQSHSKNKKKDSVRVDAIAAALILQRFLDRRSRQIGGTE